MKTLLYHHWWGGVFSFFFFCFIFFGFGDSFFFTKGNIRENVHRTKCKCNSYFHKEKMAYTVVDNCPLTFNDCVSRASWKCSNDNTYLLGDEYPMIVEVCTNQLWIKRAILSENIFLLTDFDELIYNKDLEGISVLKSLLSLQ